DVREDLEVRDPPRVDVPRIHARRVIEVEVDLWPEIGAVPRTEDAAARDVLDRVHALGRHEVARYALPARRAHDAMRTVDLVVRAVERGRRIRAGGRHLLLRVENRRVVELLEGVEIDLP